MVLGVLLYPSLFAHAACLNCGAQTSKTETTSTQKTDDTATAETNDREDGLFVPILFGVALDDITPNFTDPRDGGARAHEGLDMQAPKGTPIISPSRAKVIDYGTWPGAGIYVTTEDSAGVQYVYMHLDARAKLRKGRTVQEGDIIGFVGNTGNAQNAPSHLHFEMRIKGRAIDPYPFITREHTLEEKLAITEDILEDYNDDELAELLADQFESVFVYAQTRKLDIPTEIIRALPKIARTQALGNNDLEMGDRGTEVVLLQSKLIAGGYLDLATPTDYFGPLTKRALVAYQVDNNLSPATGYFGAETRAHMLGEAPTHGLATKSNNSELTQLVKLLIALNIIPEEKRSAAYAAIENV